MRAQSLIPRFFGTLLFLAFTAPAEAVLLYDVDFGTPPHTAGQPPVTGTGPAPRETPTEIRFGDPKVVAVFADLTDQPCGFGNGTPGYDQLRFGVGTNDADGFPEDYDDYYFSLDVVIGVLEGDIFIVYFDAPTINRLDFRDNGDIREYSSDTVIGSWDAGVTVHVEIHFDLANAIWEIWLDGDLAYTGPVSTDGKLRSIRLHQRGTNAANGAAADDFLLYGGEPPTSDVHALEGASAFALGRTLPPLPNPATDAVTIRWTARESVAVQLEITDLAGRRVWTSRAGGGPAGLLSARWDGRDAQGRVLPSGAYIVRVLAEGEILGVEKIVLRR
ncbi:MAG: FlgD immunoglobulin-like domain containing protein [Candidatus Eisenbacteria bacterium]